MPPMVSVPAMQVGRLWVVFSSLDDRALLARHHSERLGG
ncbi:hypothetical protein Q673_15910 [Marinobacter sp. EN3]|nr:hypothetical protein Q673_15910 [Marinobacter sp. EN3]